jgi:hypothetical protein
MKVKPQGSLALLVLLMLAAVTHACYNYVCSNTYPKCTKKGGDNVYINSGACACKVTLVSYHIADEECYISEDESESHCMKKMNFNFPTFLYPGYKCSFSDSSNQCTFGPKLYETP